MIHRPSSRQCALDLLESVFKRKRPLDEAFEDALDGGLGRLDALDRAILRLLVATMLRRLGQIDKALDRGLERPLPARAGRI